MERLVGNTSFEEFIAVKKTDNTEDKRLICGGSPEYINWCINTVDWFYIDPEDIGKFQKMSVFRFKEMEVTFKIEDIYSYKPHFTSEKYVFPTSTIRTNKMKYEALDFKGRDDDGYETLQ